VCAKTVKTVSNHTAALLPKLKLGVNEKLILDQRQRPKAKDQRSNHAYSSSQDLLHR